MVAMSAKLELTPPPCATARPYEHEIRSVEGSDAGRGGPEGTAPGQYFPNNSAVKQDSHRAGLGRPAVPSERA